MIPLHTSIRTREINETLKLARTFAGKLGVSRVTCTTFQDHIGIPVFTGVRPDAESGSLCISAGKGLTMMEAEVGAYMEAIEFALSETRHSACRIDVAQYQDILTAADNPEVLLDLCPIIGREIDLSAEVPCVSALDLISGREYLLPAELAYVPFNLEKAIFGNHTNGLASGNTWVEACVHGIFEVIERDILSFEFIRDTSTLVLGKSLSHCEDLIYKIYQADLDIVIRAVPNIYNFPFFAATIIDTNSRHPAFINTGYGLHSDYHIASLRALTEAAQSRLTYIHGTRDDLMERFVDYDGMTGEQLNALFLDKSGHLKSDAGSKSQSSADFTIIDGLTMQEYFKTLLDHLIKLGIGKVLAIFHSPKDDPLQVVKIVIPGLEFYNPESQRIGPRLRNYVEYVTSGAFCWSELESGCKKFVG